MHPLAEMVWQIANSIAKVSVTKATRHHSRYGFDLILLFLAHLSLWLKVSYCNHWMSVVCHKQLLQRTSPPKLLAGF